MIGLVIAAMLLAAGPGASLAAPPPVAEEIQEGLRLRARNGVQQLSSAWTIYVHTQSAHHLTEEYIRVATRGANGRWTLVSIGETRSGLLHMPTQVLPEERRDFGSGDSEDLDRLLRWPPLYRQRSPRGREVGVGANFNTMEIVTPHGHAVFRWTGRLRGWAGAVADMVMGRD